MFLVIYLKLDGGVQPVFLELAFLAGSECSDQDLLVEYILNSPLFTVKSRFLI